MGSPKQATNGKSCFHSLVYGMRHSVTGMQKRLERICFAVLAVLLIAVLTVSLFSRYMTVKERKDGSFRVITDVVRQQVVRDDAPQEYMEEYRFMLGTIQRADMLAVYISHYNAEIYLDERCVYSAATSSEIIRTLGNYWAMIPLSGADEGREVRIVLSSVYANYSNTIDIFLGAELSFYRSMLYQGLPVLLLCLFISMIGLLLLCLAIYNTVKRIPSVRIYAIGMLAFSAGLWRLTYDKWLYLFFPNDTVFLYNLSIVSLMVAALSMLNSIDTGEDKFFENIIRLGSCVYCVLDFVQMLLQLTGICDLRETLFLTHAMIIISALTLCINYIRTLRKTGKNPGQNYSWLIGIGALMDLIFYYFSDSDITIIFTIVAIVCFSFMESLKLLSGYSRQKSALDEYEMKLTLSRTATMMSQIRSHFVFNILNAISGMCKYDPEKADDTVVRFARYLRSNIDIMENDTNIPFSKDLQQLEDYVMLEQVRFGDKIAFYTDIETEDFVIPPLILQPLVENAIKHGVSRKMGSGTIVLRTRDCGKHVCITVEDDGVGFEMSELDKEHSVGIRNIRFRLEHLVNGTMEIQSQVGVGTKVTITVPKGGA